MTPAEPLPLEQCGTMEGIPIPPGFLDTTVEGGREHSCHTGRLFPRNPHLMDVVANDLSLKRVPFLVTSAQNSAQMSAAFMDHWRCVVDSALLFAVGSGIGGCTGLFQFPIPVVSSILGGVGWLVHG